MSVNPVTNDQEYIDSRDVIARIEHLRDMLNDEDVPLGRRLTEAEAEELRALESLQDEAEGSGDWLYGATLIRDDYFVEYAKQFADDIGAIDRDMSWPLYHIDWEAAARDLQVDYFDVEFDGVTYWIR